MKKNIKKFICFFTLFYFLHQQKAFAYIDPGIGSLLLQSLLAIFATISGFCLFYWQKIKNFFKKKNRK